VSGLVIGIETVRRVADLFAISAPAQSVEPFGRGHINATFLVSTGPGGHDEYVVQRLNRSVFAEPALLMDNVVLVSAHLGGRFVPEPVATRAGGWLMHDGGEAWRAWHRVAGAETIDAAPPQQAASAARLLGRFHGALAGLDPTLVHETLPRFHDPPRRLADLRRIVAADPCGRAAGVEAEIEAAFAAAPLAQIAHDLDVRVPIRVAHNDAKLDNVLFRDGEAVCLVDLDTIMPTAWFWDVGDLLRTASTRVAEDDARTEGAVADLERYRAVLDGYRSGISSATTPDPAEIEALEHAGAIVTYEQALRFLTDWIAGDVYYATTRPGQNLDRARNQLHLLASMPGTVGS
jgi:Ser/Thr protein kinase RdoA (MazF antagonist)